VRCPEVLQFEDDFLKRRCFLCHEILNVRRDFIGARRLYRTKKAIDC
jgi:hypothetical protein